MQRSGIIYTVLLSLLLSDMAFAADQEKKTEKPGQSGTVTPHQTATGQTTTARTAGGKTTGTGATKIEQIEVRGRKASTIASSATKTNTPLVETAQSVTVITRDEMDVRGVLTLNQAVRYAAGITADTRGGEGTRYDLFDLRGFTVPTFLDGLKFQDSPTGFAVAQTDTSRLERVELLKGPASALYGQSSPGGLTALSSKLPTDQRFYGGVTTTGGMFDLYRVDADVGGFATDDGLVRYRIYGTVNGQHTQLSKTGSRRFSISPAFTFGGDGPTTLTLLGNYQYDPESGSYGGVPLVGSLRRASYGFLPRNFYDGDVPSEKFNRRQGAITYIFNHRFNDDWSFSTRGRYDDIRTNPFRPDRGECTRMSERIKSFHELYRVLKGFSAASEIPGGCGVRVPGHGIALRVGKYRLVASLDQRFHRDREFIEKESGGIVPAVAQCEFVRAGKNDQHATPVVALCPGLKAESTEGDSKQQCESDTAQYDRHPFRAVDGSCSIALQRTAFSGC